MEAKKHLPHLVLHSYELYETVITMQNQASNAGILRNLIEHLSSIRDQNFSTMDLLRTMQRMHHNVRRQSPIASKEIFKSEKQPRLELMVANGLRAKNYPSNIDPTQRELIWDSNTNQGTEFIEELLRQERDKRLASFKQEVDKKINISWT